MSDDLRVTGVEDFVALSKALKHAGAGGLRKQLNKGLQEAVKPVIPKTRAAALARLPKRGGLAAQVAKEPQRVQVKTGESTAGVRLVVGKRKGGAQSANAGTIRHPIPGGKAFVNQSVKPGWFDEPAKAALPEIQQAAMHALDAVARDIARGVR